jgi:thiol-disulfide isomerase/thioredoxin
MYKTMEEYGVNPRQNQPPQDQFQVVEIQNIDHRDHIIGTNEVVVIDVYADWCGPCKMTAPTYANMASRYNKPGQVALVKYKLDNMHQSEKGTVTGIPMFNFYVRGRQVDQVIGGNIDEVETKLKSILNNMNYQPSYPQPNFNQGDSEIGSMGPTASRNSIRNSKMNMPDADSAGGQPYMSGPTNYHQPYANYRR